MIRAKPGCFSYLAIESVNNGYACKHVQISSIDLIYLNEKSIAALFCKIYKSST